MEAALQDLARGIDRYEPVLDFPVIEIVGDVVYDDGLGDAWFAASEDAYLDEPLPIERPRPVVAILAVAALVAVLTTVLAS